MEDREIIALYWARDEAAIRESDRRYPGACRVCGEYVPGSFFKYM